MFNKSMFHSQFDFHVSNMKTTATKGTMYRLSPYFPPPSPPPLPMHIFSVQLLWFLYVKVTFFSFKLDKPCVYVCDLRTTTICFFYLSMSHSQFPPSESIISVTQIEVLHWVDFIAQSWCIHVCLKKLILRHLVRISTKFMPVSLLLFFFISNSLCTCSSTDTS